MADKELRVILLTHGGAEKVLTQLCALDSVAVVGVFVESMRPTHRTFWQKIKRSIRYDGYVPTSKKLFGRIFGSNHDADYQASTIDSIERLKSIAELHHIPFQTLADYHAADSVALMRSTKPDLAVVFGTNILKESVFSIPTLGTINFHNGLVPYYRGGPPVFWELFNDQTEVGLTVHWVTTKVDAGDVIMQERVPLSYDYSFGNDFDAFISYYRGRLSDKCAELVAEAVRVIATGGAPRLLQNSSLGKRYRLPTKGEKDELKRRLRKRRRLRIKARGITQPTDEANRS